VARVLDQAEVESALAKVTGWALDGEGALALTRTFHSAAAALGFVTAVGALAERQDHHPELQWVYRTVSLRVRTHDAGNRVTERDTKLMHAIAQLA
jgi:4a-hydroxytetrahydrobiopterin dehydratase